MSALMTPEQDAVAVSLAAINEPFTVLVECPRVFDHGHECRHPVAVQCCGAQSRDREVARCEHTAIAYSFEEQCTLHWRAKSEGLRIVRLAAAAMIDAPVIPMRAQSFLSLANEINAIAGNGPMDTKEERRLVAGGMSRGWSGRRSRGGR